MSKQKVINAGKRVLLYNYLTDNGPTSEQTEKYRAEMRKVVEFCIELTRSYAEKHAENGIVSYSLSELIDDYVGEDGFLSAMDSAGEGDAGLVAALKANVEYAAVFALTFFLEHVLATLKIGVSEEDCPKTDPGIMGLVLYASKVHGEALSKEVL